MEKHHGHAGPAFILSLMEHFTRAGRLEELREQHRQLASKMGTETTEQARYAALLVLADVLARTLICGEEESQARAAALDAGQAFCAAVRKESRKTQTTADAAYDLTMGYVAANWTAFSQPVAFKRPGMVLDEKDANRRSIVALFQTTMQEIAREGRFDTRQVMTELAARGLVHKDEGHLTRKVSVEGKRVRAYCVVLDDTRMETERTQQGPARGAHMVGDES